MVDILERGMLRAEVSAKKWVKDWKAETYWGAAFWRADGRHCTRAFCWNISPSCFLLRPCPFLLSLLIQLCPSLPLFAAGFTVSKMELAVKFAFITVKGIGSHT